MTDSSVANGLSNISVKCSVHQAMTPTAFLMSMDPSFNFQGTIVDGCGLRTCLTVLYIDFGSLRS